MSDVNPAVFFSRCYPQSCDAIKIVLKEKRVFIGHPAFRADVVPDQNQLRAAVVDPWISDEEWNEIRKNVVEPRRQHQQNRNFVRQIKPGAIALVPRAAEGVVYAGRILRPFELLDNPPWAEDYLRIRQEQNCNVEDVPSVLADVAQCWEVDHFRAIPYPMIPAWIRRSLFGRSTYGRIWPVLSDNMDPYIELDRILKSPKKTAWAWTDDLHEIERRLVDGVGPNAFEHLCVALLQLEYPSDIWIHIGGTGDGGVDGIGADESGNVVGLLQCKLALTDHVFSTESLSQNTRCILSALIHSQDPRIQDGVEFWSRSHIASLVLKHASNLPIAISLRIKP